MSFPRMVLPLSGFVLLAAAVPAVKAADAAADFKQQCAMCHGADGAGNTGMGKTLKLRPLGSAEVQKQTDAELTGIISKGKGKMPAYEAKIGHDRIVALVAHLRTLKK